MTKCKLDQILGSKQYPQSYGGFFLLFHSYGHFYFFIWSFGFLFIRSCGFGPIGQPFERAWWKGLPAVDQEEGSHRRQPWTEDASVNLVDVDHCSFLLVDVDGTFDGQNRLFVTKCKVINILNLKNKNSENKKKLISSKLIFKYFWSYTWSWKVPLMSTAALFLVDVEQTAIFSWLTSTTALFYLVHFDHCLFQPCCRRCRRPFYRLF